MVHKDNKIFNKNCAWRSLNGYQFPLHGSEEALLRYLSARPQEVCINFHLDRKKDKLLGCMRPRGWKLWPISLSNACTMLANDFWSRSEFLLVSAWRILGWLSCLSWRGRTLQVLGSGFGKNFLFFKKSMIYWLGFKINKQTVIIFFESWI